MKQNEKKYTSLRTTLVFSFIILGVLISGFITAFLYLNVREQLRTDLQHRLLNMVSLAVLQQNGDLHATLQPGDENSEAYMKIQSTNASIQVTDSDIAFVYTMRMDETGQIYFVVDTNPEGEEVVYIGDIYEEPGTLLRESFLTIDQPIVEEEFYTDEFGTFLSAYAPFYNSAGQKEGVLGIDIRADTVVSREREVLTRTLMLFFISVSLIAFLSWLLGSYVTAPIIKLTVAANSIAQGSLKPITNIKIQSREIHQLILAFNKMVADLQNMITNLELRVEERTNELRLRSEELSEQSQKLELANQRNELRAAQFEAITKVAGAVATYRTLDKLLPKITQLISDQFNFYHVGIFLTDNNNQIATLTAANSAGGQRMLERKHQLIVGEQGIVGNVALTGEPRIALDVGEDAVFFNNPDLPETRSEMALALESNEKIIGVLDVQSKEAAAFNEDDLQVLSILADQVSLAIENARLFEASNKSLAEAEALYRQYLRQAWGRLPKEQKLSGFKYTSTGVIPIEGEKVPSTESTKATAKKPGISVPIKLRGESIGVLAIQVPDPTRVDTDQLDLIKAVAERVAISAENARLFEETTKRAERERLVADITTKIRSTNDPDEMIQVALDELKATLGASKVELIPHALSQTSIAATVVEPDATPEKPSGKDTKRNGR